MIVIKTIVAILNIVMAFVASSCGKKLRWENENDRATMIGFKFMIILYMMNILAILWQSE